MYKVYNGISPDFICEIFPRSNPAYNLRNKNDFVVPTVNTVFWGSEILKNMGPKIWHLRPLNIRQSPTLKSFKSNIKLWKPVNCPCRLCQPYIHDVGFIQII